MCDDILHTFQRRRDLSAFIFRALDLPEEAVKLASETNFELKGYKFSAAMEDTRVPRIVRIAVVQTAIVKSTTAPVTEQVVSVT